MMKFGLQTWGSNGDIRPFIALADGLIKAGHEVTLVVSSIDNQTYGDICRQLGIHYRQIPEHIEFDMQGFAKRSFRMHPLQWLRALLDEAFFPSEQIIYETALALATENDLMIGHHFLYPLKLAALQQDKPFVSVTFCHAAIPSPKIAPLGFPDFGPYLNPLCWKILNAVFNWALKKPLTRLWREQSQIPPANILTEMLTSQRLNLVAVDPLFCVGHEDWQGFNQICGFLNLVEDAKVWSIPDDLMDFLQQGSTPIYMTFGSLQKAVPEWSMDLFLRAVDLSGCRAIIQTSSQRYPASSRHENVYFIGKHPHQPLFKHCAAVVHHGGAGTTHAATRSGCPSIVIPFMDEQLYWAKQLQRLALAGPPLPAKSVTAEALAEAINDSLASSKTKVQAEQAGQTMRADDGVARAVTLLERLLPTRWT
ncbi:MAG: glycosyltransferase [Gammaproteobacteria bacterium]